MPSPTTALMIVMLALGTAAVGARTLVPRMGDAIGKQIAQLSSVLPARPPPVDVATDDEPAPAGADLADPDARPAAPARVPDAHHRAAGARRPDEKPASGGSIDIPADRVARITEKQLRRLSASDAVDRAGHPIGARLAGVSALNLGLADGDVVTTIDGSPTPDVTTATAAAMRAFASGEAAAHATVARGGRTLLVTVHIPAKGRPGRRA